MKNRLIITESDKQDIKNLYNIDENFVEKLLDLYSSQVPSTDSSDDNYDVSSTLNPSDSFNKVTDFVIQKFEGGYWNPYCPNHSKSNMGVSTETMFGLDRYNGNIESTDEGKQFFGIIDKEKKDAGAYRVGKKWFRMGEFCKKWTHGYKGGDKETKLRDLAVSIMRKNYDRNVNNYFSPELKKRVEKNPGLALHFSYATWNGPGFFKKFAKILSDKLSSQPNISDGELIKQAVNDRAQTKLYNKDKVASAITDKNLINKLS